MHSTSLEPRKSNLKRNFAEAINRSRQAGYLMLLLHRLEKTTLSMFSSMPRPKTLTLQDHILSHHRPNQETRLSRIYSTVTLFAKFLGKSTFKPSATASQYAISCNGITFSKPCKQSTVFGISIFSALLLENSSSSGLQITIGLPDRAMTIYNTLAKDSPRHMRHWRTYLADKR